MQTKIEKKGKKKQNQNQNNPKNKKQKYIRHCRTVPKPYSKTVERGKIDPPNTQIHNRSFSLLGTSTSIKSVYLRISLNGIYLPGSNKCFLANQFKKLL